MMSLADPAMTNKVKGQEAVTFFKRSGLDIKVLKDIWKVASRTSAEYLTRDEFYIALRLIAYAQNGITPNEDAIQFNIEVELPKFDEAPLGLPAPQTR